MVVVPATASRTVMSLLLLSAIYKSPLFLRAMSSGYASTFITVFVLADASILFISPVGVLLVTNTCENPPRGGANVVVVVEAGEYICFTIVKTIYLITSCVS